MMMRIYITHSAAAACLTTTTTASQSSNYMYMLYGRTERISSSVYSRIRVYAHYASLYARIRVIVCCETRYSTPLPLTTLLSYCVVCGDAPLIPSEQREYYRCRRRSRTFRTTYYYEIIVFVCVCVWYRILVFPRRCLKEPAIFKKYSAAFKNYVP